MIVRSNVLGYFLVGVNEQFFDADPSLITHLDNLLLEVLLDYTKQVSFYYEKLLLAAIFDHHLFGKEADRAHVLQGAFDDSFQTVLGESIGHHELPAVFAASNHFGVEDVGLDVIIALEDIVAIYHDESAQFLLLAWRLKCL